MELQTRTTDGAEVSVPEPARADEPMPVPNQKVAGGTGSTDVCLHLRRMGRIPSPLLGNRRGGQLSNAGSPGSAPKSRGRVARKSAPNFAPRVWSWTSFMPRALFFIEEAELVCPGMIQTAFLTKARACGANIRPGPSSERQVWGRCPSDHPRDAGPLPGVPPDRPLWGAQYS